MKKITFIIGNGFNMFLKNYFEVEFNNEELLVAGQGVKQRGSKRKTSDLILDVIDCLKEYCDLLDDIYLKKDQGSKGEELLQDIYNLSKKIDCPEIMETIEESVKERIKNVFLERTEKGKTKYINATIRTLLKRENYFSEYLYDTLNSRDKINVITTNYDYIVKSVFTEVQRGRANQNFTFLDIHGSYEDEIVCTAPELKKGVIDSNEKLRNKFVRFKNIIGDSEIIILLGISLTSDAHILNELNKLQGKRFIIVDADRDQYIHDHYPKVDNEGTHFLLNNKVNFINTYKPIIDSSVLIAPTHCPYDLVLQISKIIERDATIHNK